MDGLEEVTALVINYRTPDLTRRCLESLRRFYPRLPVLVIENGSTDVPDEYLNALVNGLGEIDCLANQQNIFHGPALDQGIRRCRTPRVLTLDSDVQIVKGGFLEKMQTYFAQDADLYALGKVVAMDPFGYEAPQSGRGRFLYVRPNCMLLDRNKYLVLKPFIHHGSPGIRNMRHAQRRGFKLADFPTEEYIHHLGRGTCSRYGYGLGLRHTVENVLHRIYTRFTYFSPV